MDLSETEIKYHSKCTKYDHFKIKYKKYHSISPDPQMGRGHPILLGTHSALPPWTVGATRRLSWTNLLPT